MNDIKPPLPPETAAGPDVAPAAESAAEPAAAPGYDSSTGETPVAPAPPFRARWRSWLITAALVFLACAVGVGSWYVLRPRGPGPGFASGNGRIEAREIDVATKLPGRVDHIAVREGDFVQSGQVLATMRDDTLLAQRAESSAYQQQARDNVAGMQAQVAMRESEQVAAIAVVAQQIGRAHV